MDLGQPSLWAGLIVATQKEVLKAVDSVGFYTARLYQFDRCTRGIRDVAPAEALVKKGILRLTAAKTDYLPNGGKVTVYTWARNIGGSQHGSGNDRNQG